MSYTLNKFQEDPARQRQELMQLGKQLLEDGRLPDAWKVLLLAAG
ncbi:hypothetical protein HNQ93_002247 [Hymenobacter luteus]|uniref:Uncharacterized protein n=2 Tax=Hymenobacter TaxID=89966 RepID=A0A7W9T0K8_9BACT|nr:MULTISPECIES: hypothetical protein [Hymenobacter]MBB4602184.1 hypothetical protein [Hymenobacter latericoloratus]MBB6059387.1 hypothetical protein [Hymenobacter luteus]